MKKIILLGFAVFVSLWIILAANPGAKSLDMNIAGQDLKAKTQSIPPRNDLKGVKPDIDFDKIPLYFVSNQGQVNKQAKFYAKASRYTLWMTKEGLVFDSFKKQNTEFRTQNTGKKIQATQKLGTTFTNDPSHRDKYERSVSRLMFIGADKNPEIAAVEPAKLKVNYFIGNDRSKWNCDVPTSTAVLYKNLYKNIDLKVYGIEKQIEYDWIVNPGGNPQDIRFEYKNVKGTRFDGEGNLIIETDFGDLIHKKPVSYQINKMQGGDVGVGSQTCPKDRKDIDVTFKKVGKNTYGFAVEEYDRSRELIIDPLVLIYSTYLGGGSGDYGCDIAVDGSGYVYVTGDTGSTDFPTLNQYQTYRGASDVFVAKLDTSQSGAASLLYSTYLGGGSGDFGCSIALDDSGNVYVMGDTNSTDFPTLNQYQTDQGTWDVFVAKLDPSQSGAAGLLYSTYLGGGGSDYSYGTAVDGSGNVYVTGDTDSTDFPTLNQYQADQGGRDVFVAKLDTAQSGASGLLYSTYLGGGGSDYSYGTAVDDSGNVYVAGYTFSTDFPTLNQYQTDQGGNDAFVTKLDPSQSGAAGLLYSTYLGGSSGDYLHSIAVGGSGNVYVTGDTDSTDFPTLNQYQTDQGYRDVFVARVDTTRSGDECLLYSTYLGGGSYDYGYGIAVDGSGNVYVTGYTDSTNFPILNQFQTYQGTWDVFVAKLDPSQSGAAGLLYSTYLGGGDEELGYGIAVNGSDNFYVAGCTRSTDFPTLDQFHTFQGSDDVFVAKFSFCTKLITVTSPNDGEDWKLSSIQNITWNTVCITGNLKITLRKGESFIGVIADNVAPAKGSGSYAWMVGKLIDGSMVGIGSDYKIKIKETGTAAEDSSDADFTLSPGITVTAPNGGQTWKIGNVKQITWRYGGLTNQIKITLYKDNVLVGIIATVDPAGGPYAWTVGSYTGGTAAAGTGYTIKIKEIGTAVADTSDATFELIL